MDSRAILTRHEWQANGCCSIHSGQSVQMICVCAVCDLVGKGELAQWRNPIGFTDNTYRGGQGALTTLPFHWEREEGSPNPTTHTHKKEKKILGHRIWFCFKSLFPLSVPLNCLIRWEEKTFLGERSHGFKNTNWFGGAFLLRSISFTHNSPDALLHK